MDSPASSSAFVDAVKIPAVMAFRMLANSFSTSVSGSSAHSVRVVVGGSATHPSGLDGNLVERDQRLMQPYLTNLSPRLNDGPSFGRR